MPGVSSVLSPLVSFDKRVRFDDKVTVFYQTDWPNIDYRLARRGTWRTDRIRFERRIREMSNILSPLLTDEHRMLVRLRNMTYDT